MSTVVFAAPAAGTALGLLLILAGLTGRQLFDGPSGYIHRARSSSLLPKVAIAAVAACATAKCFTKNRQGATSALFCLADKQSADVQFFL